MYEISLFPEGADASATRNVVTREQLTPDLLLKHPWAPGLFKDGVRANKNLESIGLLVLDIDEGCTLNEALKIFANYKHVIGTSKSHQLNKNGVVCDRFRVILFLEQHATSDSEFKEYWFAAFAKWPFIDKACKDSARFFFPCKEIVSVNESGALFGERRYLEKTQVTNAPSNVTKKGKLSKATKDFLAEGAPPGEWHGRFFKACMDFKEQGYTEEEATSKLQLATGHLDETDLQQIEDVYSNREPKYGPRNVGLITDWPVMIPTKDGEKLDRNHPDNLEHLISKMGYDLAYNEMDMQVYSEGEKITDIDLTEVWKQVKRHGLQHGKDFIAAMLENIAFKKRYHPIKQIIESHVWDKQDHIGALYKTLIVDGDEDYSTYLRKWLIGIIAKVYRPGSQNLVLTFVGAQGIGKSRWFTKLALYEKAFGEGAIDPSNKDHELRHLSHLIWHIPELDYTTGKRETGALKDYLTRDFVNVRPAFARYTREGRSVCSFAASVNAEEFLVDQTGNRRYLIIPLNAIDHNHNVDIQQVFAQAKALFEAGEQWWLTTEELAELNDRNSKFEIKDVVASFVDTLESGPDEMTGIEICALMGIHEPSMAVLTRLGAALKRHGIKKARAQVGRVRHYVYLVKNPKGSNKMKTPSVV